jgi:hypothetical protein
MFRFDADLQVYLHREPIDFRAGLNTLVTVVEQSMQLDPLARAVLDLSVNLWARHIMRCKSHGYANEEETNGGVPGSGPRAAA